MAQGPAPRIADLAARIARIEGGARPDAGVIPLGVPAIDACLPGGSLGGRGLPLGRWHEVAADGMETELSAAPALFAGLAASPLARRGEAVWVFRRDDLWAPGLAGLGFPARAWCRSGRGTRRGAGGDGGRPGDARGLGGLRRGRDGRSDRRAAAATGLRATRIDRIRPRPTPLRRRGEATGTGDGGGYALAGGLGPVRAAGRGGRPGRAASGRDAGTVPGRAARRLDSGGRLRLRRRAGLLQGGLG